MWRLKLSLQVKIWHGYNPIYRMHCVDEFVKSHFRIGFSSMEMISLLADKHSQVICIRMLKRWCRKMHLVRRKKHKVRRVGQTCVKWMHRCKDFDGNTLMHHKTADQVVSLTHPHKAFAEGTAAVEVVRLERTTVIYTFQLYSQKSS